MIRRFSVTGVGGQGKIEKTFDPEINIFTGRNGSGKTTLMKLIWYLISGNIERALQEVPFVSAEVETDKYIISINRRSNNDADIRVSVGQENLHFSPPSDDDDDFGSPDSYIDEANTVCSKLGTSLFFPTFRRIEGGFSLASTRRGAVTGRLPRSQSSIEEGLFDLSRRLSNGRHLFIASFSTVDIVDLLMRKYTELSEQNNVLQRTVSERIIERIKLHKNEVRTADAGTSVLPESRQSAEETIDEIRRQIEQLDAARLETLAPLEAIKNLVEKLFHHSGIVLNARVSFGDAAHAVNSDQLSAGEKQMLSFICYNAFYQNATIFIDEPELSLHVDWQRQIFPILQRQGSSNQFIVATHSPFIYSKFPEKEIILQEDRGE
ncbi:AAA family ATPase [Paracraurococcus ruber]|nr:ATP-binding protein [Paracraurococcus ruber]